MPQEGRGKAYLEQLTNADWRAKLVKLADVYDNLCEERETGHKGNSRQQARAMLAISEADSRLQTGASALRQLMARLDDKPACPAAAGQTTRARRGWNGRHPGPIPPGVLVRIANTPAPAAVERPR